VAVEFPRKGLASNRFYGERFTRWSSVTAPSSRSRAARSSGSLPLDRATALKVRAASTLLPTLFPSSTGSRLSPSSSHGAIHEMAQTGRSNVRYVDPQRRYTVVLGPSWNAPIGTLPHDDRAGTHDSADGRCGSYASIGSGQAPTKVFRRYPQSAVCSPLEVRSTSISGIHLRTRALPGRATTGLVQCSKRRARVALFYDHLVWPGTHHSRNGIYGTWGRWLFRHDVGDSNHLGPFLRFNCDISAELPGGENHRYGADLGEL
jgi:hypothetical protein